MIRFEVSGIVVSYSDFIVIENVIIVVGVIGVMIKVVVISVWFV